MKGLKSSRLGGWFVKSLREWEYEAQDEEIVRKNGLMVGRVIWIR